MRLNVTQIPLQETTDVTDYWNLTRRINEAILPRKPYISSKSQEIPHIS